MKKLLSLFSVLLASGAAAGRALRSSASLGVVGCLLATAVHAAPAKTAEPLVISHGETVNLADYVVPGKTTVFDFTSKYCGPCQGYNQPLHDLHAQRADLAVVKVDINRPEVKAIDWLSPVARQFDLHLIPHFKVYGPDGKLLAEDKVVFGADGRPDRVASSSAAHQLVDGWIDGLAPKS